MQGFLWLLLQMALLLLAAAIVFFWLGWHWRGRNAIARIADLNTEIDAESRSAESARRDRDSAHAHLDQLKASQLREAADLQEAQDRQRGLEREILRLADELKVAKSQIKQPEPEPEPEPPAAPPTTTATETSAEPKTVIPAKESRLKKPAAAPAKPTKTVNGRNVLKRLEKSLATQAIVVETLRTKRDECQVRADEAKSQNDRAGLRLATKNLAQSSKLLAEAVESLESRQRQVRAVTASLAAPAARIEDDLTHIKGVKGAINDQLRSLGIRTYRQIALWTDEEAIAFGELLAIKKNATRDLWRTQARELHLATHGTEPA